MKLFLISQIQNDDYDTYHEAVVCAPDAETARNMNPSNGKFIDEWGLDITNIWCSAPEQVVVRYIGESADGMEQGVVCVSFNAS